MPDPDPPETGATPDPKPRTGPGPGAAIVAAIISITLTVGLATAYVSRTINQPADPAGQETTLVIHPGTTLLAISEALHDRGIITHSLLFRLLARYQGLSTRLQAGEYALSPAMSPRQILAILARGKTLLHRLTIPEGLTFREAALLVEQSGFGTRKRFMDLCTDKTFLHSLGIDQDSVEGYLFPETYFFPKTASQETIIRVMIQGFNAVFIPRWHQRARDLGLTVHQVTTLASIIEKETGDGSERPLIASVFHNRLNRGMRLESDPTVIYGIPDFNGNITRKDLQELTPYNTYRIPGLPPGPIANPGRASLEAALFPADTDFLFFVSKNDTTHYFSRTHEEHNRAVRHYQMGRQVQGKALSPN